MTSADQGGWIASQWGRDDFANNLIFLVRPDGSDNHLLLPDMDTKDQLDPDWSPDGARIAFVIGRGDRSDLWIADTNGMNARRVVTCSLPCNTISKPDWSPDGTRILYTEDLLPLDANGIPSTFEIRAVRPDGGTNATLLSRVDGMTAESARWSPDGTQFVFVRARLDSDETWRSALFVANVGNAAIDRITPWNMGAVYPDWGPTDRIVFTTYDLSTFPDATIAGNLYTSSPDGTQLERVTTFAPNAQVATQPRWTPDGTAIIFTDVARNGDPVGIRTMTLVAPEGTDLRPATATAEPGTHPTMQPTP